MLEEVLRYVNNRFERSCVSGSFSASGGTIAVDGALAGQWIWVEGSALNDGLWQYPPEGMADEEFQGRVWLLAIPRALADLADEIAAWCEAHASELDSPYQSESFGGYSYSRAQGGSQGNEAPAAGWHAQFGARLRPYRKLYRDWT